MVDSSGFNRRTVLATTAGLAAGSLAGCSAGGGGGNASPDFDGWLDDVSNYDGVADRTGEDAVEITVGAEGNDGNFGFAPAAVTVSAGTTVVWRWNGKGSLHNVVAQDGSFESEMYGTAGETFERTFEREGTHKYYCEPHKSSGMKGIVVVE